MPSSKTFKCGGCADNISKTQASIQCRSCMLWLHVSCSGVSDKDFAALKGNKHFSYTCSSCSKCPPSRIDTSVKDDINALKSLIDNFIKKVDMEQTSTKNSISALNSKIDDFITKADNEQCCIKQALADSVDSLRSDIASCCREMKSEVIDCNKLIKYVDASASAKISALEEENNILHRRLNRADIVVNGLPAGIGNLIDPIKRIAAYYNISLSANDIHHVCYINNRKSILVKFNCVFLRDSIMAAYFKTRSIKVRDIVEGDIDLRIYLNDHFGPAASKLNAICRKLLHKKLINKFRIQNGDRLRVKLTMADGSDVVYNMAECISLLNTDV